MLRTLLSTMAVALFTFGPDAQAQVCETQVIEAGMPGKALPKTSSLDLRANEYWWGYWDGNTTDNISYLGMGSNSKLPQEYSGAICIPASVGKGNTIEGIKFTLGDVEGMSDVKIWVSTELPFGAENATYTCQEIPVDQLTSMRNKQDCMNEIRFDKPCVFPDNSDVYVGYTFVVNAIDKTSQKYPVLVKKGNDPTDNSMFLRFGNQKKNVWQDKKKNGILMMHVLMSGDFETNSAAVPAQFEDIYGSLGDQFTIPLVVENRGQAGVESINYTITVNGESTTNDMNAYEEITGIGTKYQFDIPVVPEITESGIYNVSIKLNKVNSEPNECVDNTMNGKIMVLSKSAHKKVLVEEFTGLWCGACPVGLVGMEKLKKDFGDDVVILGLHYNDPLQSADCKNYIKNGGNGTYPNSHMDRTYKNVYPYTGTGKNGREGKAGYGGYGIGNDVKKLMETISLAEVTATGYLDGDIFTAKADVDFLLSGNVDCALGFVITEDGKHDSSWGQKNYLNKYNGQGWEDEEPMFDIWVNGDDVIFGFVYNDVAIAAEGIVNGIDGSIPAEVEADKTVTYETQFDLSEYTKIQDRENLSLAVFLVDRTSGKILNCDSKKLSVMSSVNGVESKNDEIKEVARYTVDGRMVDAPVKGINIIKYSDGSVKKVFR